MHFCFLAMLIGEMKGARLNTFTAIHFSESAKNQWTKTSVRDTVLLIGRFYMNEEKVDES